MTYLKRLNNTDGFTIVELMIATTVLSVIILLVSIVMINIGVLFNKGVNQARTQNNTRSITDELTQQLRLTGAPTVNSGTDNTTKPPYTFKSFCIGNTRYSYVTDYQIGTGGSANSQVSHVLWRDTWGGACKPVDLSRANPQTSGNGGTNGVELIASNSRLTAFSTTLSSPYSLTVGVAYGDPTLTTPPSGGGINTVCNSNIGQQFCATASLSTIVVQRIP